MEMIRHTFLLQYHWNYFKMERLYFKKSFKTKFGCPETLIFEGSPNAFLA